MAIPEKSFVQRLLIIVVDVVMETGERENEKWHFEREAKKRNEKSLINLIISLTKRKMMFLYQFIVLFRQ